MVDRSAAAYVPRMRSFGPIVASLVVGLALGAWQPRGELLRLRAENAELRSREAIGARSEAAAGIREILRARAPGAPSARDDEAPADDDDAAEPLDAADGPDADGASASEPSRDGRRPEGLNDAQALADAMDARRAQAEAALAEQADLDEEEAAAVRAVMDEMNAQLSKEVEAFVRDALANGEVERRDMLAFAADSLDVVLAADDAMREALPEGALDGVDDTLVDPLAYISGDTLAPLTRLEGTPGLE